MLKSKFSYSSYVWNTARDEMFDYINVITDKMVLAIMKKAIKRDALDVLIRPFQKSSWIVAMIIFVTLAICGQGMPLLYKQNGSHFRNIQKFRKTTIFLTWSLFMLIEIYYEGALTMFLTTEKGVSFKSIKDVMKAYPEWKLMMRSGFEVYYMHHVESGDEDYLTFWDRVEMKPKESVFHGVNQVLEDHRNDQVVIHEVQSAINVYKKNGKYDTEDTLQVFQKGHNEYFGMIVTENSPLGPILQYGAKVMTERGTLDYLKTKWLGEDDIVYRSPADNVILDMSHLSLVFAGLTLAFGLSVTLFLVELILRHRRWSCCNASDIQQDPRSKYQETKTKALKQLIRHVDIESYKGNLNLEDEKKLKQLLEQF